MRDRYDDEFHDERLASLYQETRRVEPPDWLDQRILAMAQSTTVPPRPTSGVVPLATAKQRTQRWRVPLTLAATLVLTVGVVKMTTEFTNTPAPLRMETAESVLKSAAEPMAGADSVVIERPALPADEAASFAPSPPAGPSGRSLPAPSAVAPAPSVPPAAPSTPPTAIRPHSAKSLERNQQPEQDTVPTPVEAIENKAKTGTTPKHHPAPHDWLAHITHLRRQGHMAEADASLAEFRRVYPDYPLKSEPPSR